MKKKYESKYRLITNSVEGEGTESMADREMMIYCTTPKAFIARHDEDTLVYVRAGHLSSKKLAEIDKLGVKYDYQQFDGELMFFFTESDIEKLEEIFKIQKVKSAYTNKKGGTKLAVKRWNSIYEKFRKDEEGKYGN